MKHNSYEMKVLIKGSTPTSEYKHTDNNTYIEGRAGSIYNIHFTNNSEKRILFVPSVDGLSVISGEPADIKGDGYILNPYQTVVVPGWRLNDAGAKPFKFCDPDRNFVLMQTGRLLKSGVIGAAIFEEADLPPPENPNPFPAANGKVDLDSKSSLGGLTYENTPELVNFKTREVEFVKKANSEPQMLILFYDSIEGLKSRGIQVQTKRNKGYQQNAFPANNSLAVDYNGDPFEFDAPKKSRDHLDSKHPWMNIKNSGPKKYK